MSKSYSKTRILVECALMIAVGTVLSSIKFFTLPNGGSVTLLSMLPFVLVSSSAMAPSGACSPVS